MTRTISPEGVALVKAFEGFSAALYRCPAGYLTIGYGHRVKEEEVPRFLRGISEAQGEALLRQDLAIIEAQVRPLLPETLAQGQWDALISFAFNVGAGRLRHATLRQKVLAGDHTGAAKEFLRWVYAKGQPLSGLRRRRLAEMRRYQG
ncbi:MAG: lysozyme [Alphaproteobacteria bacterium]